MSVSVASPRVMCGLDGIDISHRSAVCMDYHRLYAIAYVTDLYASVYAQQIYRVADAC
jgi:hypothetical protein